MTIQPLAAESHSRLKNSRIWATINIQMYNKRPSYTVNKCPYINTSSSYENGSTSASLPTVSQDRLPSDDTFSTTITTHHPDTTALNKGTSSTVNSGLPPHTMPTQLPILPISSGIQHSRVAGFPSLLEAPSTPPIHYTEDDDSFENNSIENGVGPRPSKRIRVTPPE